VVVRIIRNTECRILDVKSDGTYNHRLTFGGGGGCKGGKCSPPIFFLPENSFLLATELKRGK
jgi:hypothetical protein